MFVQFSSVTQLCPTLRPHELQHARPPCPSPAPGVYSNPCPLSQWCHPTISSSVVPFSSCLQSFPASGSFQISQFFVSGGQSIAVSPSASVLPMNIQSWLLLGWTGWISLLSKGLSRVFSNQIRSDQLLRRVRLCNPMNRSTPGLPVHHQLPEFTQTHVHWVVSDAIQPSYPLSSPFPSAFNLSQHQGLFKLVSCLHQVAKVLELQLQHQSSQWIFRVDFL